MKAVVRIHPETYGPLFSDVAKDFPGLIDTLIADFKRYVDQGELPDYFGRDVPYVEPAAAFNARLMHLHLKVPPGSFPARRPQRDRTSDTALVYVRGELEEHEYCLLALFHPGAHKQARNPAIMQSLARLAKKFRDEH
ncbi:type II toxin-antitoxin system YafO family toxin [Azotobacter chroococcum]|uniref:type II toxin-antitoxin system YafO family toxin n=1 Tax=Azotobacter chroococcum TaxID=353 RepID=UPI000B77CF8F|nr:type II toxin-antitoxin system YafO family toxin [Azotobacter chroococcum]